MSEARPEDWKHLFSIMNGFVHTQALAAACDLGLFGFLAAHPGADQRTIAARLSLSAYSTRVLMLACCATGLVHRDERTLGYRNSDIAEKTLIPGSPECAIPFVQFTSRVMERCGMHLAECFRQGTNAALDREFPGEGDTLYKRIAQHPDMQRLFQEAMGFYSRINYSLDETAEFGAIRHLLDAGGGNGSNAVKLCRKFPHLRVTVLELPKSCEIGRQYVASHGLTDRIAFSPGDLFAAPYPPGCDGVLMAHLTGIFSEATVESLHRKAYDYLPPGGRLVVWSPAANDLETGGVEAAKLSLYFHSVASGEGLAWSAQVQETLLRRCGFREVTRHAGRLEHAVLVAMK